MELNESAIKKAREEMVKVSTQIEMARKTHKLYKKRFKGLADYRTRKILYKAGAKKRGQ